MWDDVWVRSISWDTKNDIDEVPTGKIDGPAPDGFTQVDYYWTLSPCPARERIDLNFVVGPQTSFDIKDVFFGTQCIPEPTMMSLVLIGGLLGVVVRRREAGSR